MINAIVPSIAIQVLTINIVHPPLGPMLGSIAITAIVKLRIALRLLHVLFIVLGWFITFAHYVPC